MYKLPYVVSLTPGKDHQTPYVHFQNTAFPGDEKIPLAELMVFDLAKERRTDLDMPGPVLAYGPMPDDGLRWSSDGKKVYATHESRDFRKLSVYEADARTGKAKIIATDQSALPLRPDVLARGRIRVVDKGDEVILYSERDDWAHYYLYDTKDAALKNRITKGKWVVHHVQYIDARNRWLYFTAGGREKGRDPYYSHLYRVRLDGTNLTLLTPEDAHHDIEFSPDGKFFIDRYSTVFTPPVTVLRDRQGKMVMELMKADITNLEKLGWTPPRRFKVKAADHKTYIYGTLFLPANLDKNKSYPIIDMEYAGPQNIYAPRRFLENRQFAIATAQLGFAVMVVDGRGTALRRQSFQDVEFGENFGSPVIVADHIAAMKQLAERHTFIDIKKAGIYGYSWGGYRAARAMMQFPDFFKAGVASAGSHDNFNYIFEHDRWFGMARDFPDTYKIQSNIPLAAKLKNKLLLIHGDADDNVHVANTLQMADALIKANKDFEMLIYPGQNHGTMRRQGYFIRKHWDFFTRHLQGLAPPDHIKIPNGQ